ncbi:sugar transferase [Paenibacillaceae bacterium]|nr:sugar transferase [Paenibacillaceae bacterium]
MAPSSRNELEVRTGAAGYYKTAGVEGRSVSVFYLVSKRILDVCASAVGILLLLPLFLLVALAIKLEDPRGKVLFSQIRVGREGRTFRMYKFRSMVYNAEDLLKELLSKNEIEGAMFKMKDDPRITRVGKLIRKTSIDELPQLLNVLRGEMSLVGPRPPLPREVAEYSDYDRQRLAVTPGCTGLWQVSGRNELSFAEMVELDLTYIRTRSLLRDIGLIFRTIKQMVFARDAY